MLPFKYIIFITLVLNINILFASEEAPTQEEIAKLYVATFNRAPDNAGLDYWVNSSGLKLSEIAQSFFDQEETQTLYPSGVSNRDFIEAIYYNLFNREPDEGGWNYWEEQINLGNISRNRFIEAVIAGAEATTGSDEDTQILANKTEIGLYYSSKELNNTDWAKYILSGISSDIQTVNFAKDMINQNNFSETMWDDFILKINYSIVDTSQNLCYESLSGIENSCTGKGYDADYQKNEPSYTVSDSENIVIDNVTDLMWTRSSDLDSDGNYSDVDDKKSQSEAIEYCENLNLDGYSDWRLPNIKTLYSLILFSGEDPSSISSKDTSNLKTFLDDSFTDAFGDTSSGERIIDAQYATTTDYVYTTMDNEATMFGVNFVDGRIKGYPTENKQFYLLCVRGNENYGVNDFTDNEDGTITDNSTGLMWQQNDTQSINFEDAINICENLSLAGSSDWRLPNIKELQSIVDYSKSPDTTNSAAIDDIFNSTSITNEKGELDWGYYWSSTTHATSENGVSAAYISFGRALGNMNEIILDVHGAGAQRSNAKMSESNDPIVESALDSNSNPYYFKGPQGDILRIDNMVRCVRDAI